MDFNELINEKLLPFFQKHNFEIIEQRKNYIMLKSKFIVVVFCYNPLEYVNMFWLGRIDETSHLLEDIKDVKFLFGQNAQLDFSSTENFIKDILFLFQYQAKPILEGDLKIFEVLDNYMLEKSRKYNQDIMDKQNRNKASKAWSDNNYLDFVAQMDKISKEKWSESDKIKYRMASERS